jgi:zinc protease
MEQGPDADELARIKTQFRASEIYAMDNTEGRANSYGRALAVGLTLEDIDNWLPLVEATTPDQIMEAARKLFDPRRSVTGFVAPPAKIEATLTESSKG